MSLCEWIKCEMMMMMRYLKDKIGGILHFKINSPPSSVQVWLIDAVTGKDTEIMMQAASSLNFVIAI